MVLRTHIFTGSMFSKRGIMASSNVVQFVPASSRYSSWVWQHFGFCKKEDDGPVKRDKTCCKQCNELLAYTQGNTSNMMRHLQRKHGIKVPEKEDKKPSFHHRVYTFKYRIGFICDTKAQIQQRTYSEVSFGHQTNVVH